MWARYLKLYSSLQNGNRITISEKVALLAISEIYSNIINFLIQLFLFCDIIISQKSRKAREKAIKTHFTRYFNFRNSYAVRCMC